MTAAIEQTDFPTTLEVKSGGTYAAIGNVIDISDFKITENALEAYIDDSGNQQFIAEGITRVDPLSITLSLTGLIASGSGTGTTQGEFSYYKLNTPFVDKYFYGLCTSFTILGSSRLGGKPARGVIVIQPDGPITNTAS